MNKIVYSFWTAPLRKRWANYRKDHELEDLVQSSLNCLYLSVLYAKKWGFEVEIVTDIESEHYFRELPVDFVTTDLTFLDYQDTWTKGKMLAIAKQTEPFVHMDWDVMLTKKEVADLIKDCTSDVLVQSLDAMELDHDIRGYDINFHEIQYLKWRLDFESAQAEDMIRSYDEVCNSSVVGFNDLKLRDKYVSEYLKCLKISNDTNWMDLSRMIDQYTLQCTIKANKATITKLLPNKKDIQQTANNIGYAHFSFLSKYTKTVQSKIINKIKTEFSQYSYLVNSKSYPIKNDIKISLCTVTMNRFDHTIKTLKHNLKVVREFKGQIDINVLDYNSTDGLEDYLFSQTWFLSGIKDGLIHYYKNYTAEYYHRTLPKNVIHNLALGEYLINIDADNYVSQSYLTYCLVTATHENNFFLRPSRHGANGSIGRILIHRDDFRRIGGYNLKIENYGYEDTEITLRLRKMRIQQLYVPSHLCLDVIEHEDKLRLINEKPRAKVKFDHMTEDSDYENKKMDFELFPNKNINPELELFRINHNRQKIKVYDTRTHTLDRAI